MKRQKKHPEPKAFLLQGLSGKFIFKSIINCSSPAVCHADYLLIHWAPKEFNLQHQKDLPT